MAFLVCYSNKIEDHTKERAAYLDQSFYKCLFDACSPETSGYKVLRSIALLKYNSQTIQIGLEKLRTAAAEITRLPTNLKEHKSTHELEAAIDEALSRGCSLTISGDMYPELS